MHSNLINTKGTTRGNVAHYFGMAGYPTVGLMVSDDLTAGSFLPQASIDGKIWANVLAYNPDGTSTATITLAGIYRFDVNGYDSFRLLPSSDFSGLNVEVQSVASPMPLNILGVGASGAVKSAGTFTATLTGCTTAPTVVAVWERVGDIVTMRIPAVTATSNSAACTLTGMSAGVWPVTVQEVVVNGVEDNTIIYGLSALSIGATGVITLEFAAAVVGALTSTFTAIGGTKGLSRSMTFTYLASP